MFTGSIVVAGAGVAGLATSLLLARDGHDVTLIERDADRGPEIAPSARRGVPHYLQPHAMIPRARDELRRSLPDVYADLLASGASDVDLRPKINGPLIESDELLQYVAVRRPLLETALRRAVQAQPRIYWHTGERCVVAPEADLVVDALGRTSCLKTEETETSDCGVVYYCRYYQVRSGCSLPDGPWLLSPRGDLGYFAFSTFPGDNGTFATVLAVPPGDADWKRLHEADVYEAAVASIPQLATWRDPELCDPITDVLAMAGLRNVAPPSEPRPGRVAVGDALGHTDPVLAHGLAFALIHAKALTHAARSYVDVGDLASAYLEEVRPLIQERYEFSTALDAERLNRWRGGQVDFARDRALFAMLAGGALAATDAEAFRLHMRRLGLLDSTSVIDEDAELLSSWAKRISRLTPPVSGPSREEMVALVRA